MSDNNYQSFRFYRASFIFLLWFLGFQNPTDYRYENPSATLSRINSYFCCSVPINRFVFCLLLHRIGDCFIVCWWLWLVENNNREKKPSRTINVFQVRIPGLKGERLRGRKETRYLTVSTLNIIREHCIVFKLIILITEA